MAEAVGEIDVANFALCILTGAINTDSPLLDSWDEEQVSQTALPTLQFFKTCYPRAIRKMQSSWDWPEVTRYAVMGAALDDATALLIPGYDYIYSRPENCLAFRGVVSAAIEEHTGARTEYPFAKVGSQIACNVANSDEDNPDYVFRYTILEENVGLWSEELFQATAHLLALYTCRPLGGTLENAAMVKGLLDVAFAEARAACQSRVYVPGRRAMTGASAELAPGVIDWNFPLPE